MATTSYLNLILFLLTTLVYYLVLKPAHTIEQLKSPDLENAYIKSSYSYLGIYLFATILIQFFANIAIISTNCGGKITQNIGYSAIVTFLPWLLIFGVIITVLQIYPGLKKIFSDVFGYFFVSSTANKLLTELLINKEIQSKIESDTSVPESSKQKMQEAADLIIKICGNMSVLINQLTPKNFLEYWDLLTPLMKQKYQNPSEETLKLQKQLWEIVVTKENIGEVSWLIYTGILLVSLVQLKINTRGCVNNIETQKANYNDFLDKEKEAAAQKELAQSTVYTISS